MEKKTDLLEALRAFSWGVRKVMNRPDKCNGAYAQQARAIRKLSELAGVHLTSEEIEGIIDI